MYDSLLILNTYLKIFISFFLTSFFWVKILLSSNKLGLLKNLVKKEKLFLNIFNIQYLNIFEIKSTHICIQLNQFQSSKNNWCSRKNLQFVVQMVIHTSMNANWNFTLASRKNQFQFHTEAIVVCIWILSNCDQKIFR